MGVCWVLPIVAVVCGKDKKMGRKAWRSFIAKLRKFAGKALAPIMLRLLPPDLILSCREW
jgi:hypothetical protein